ncbi:hypothetical protein JXM83_04560 [Candidatus Woesearchaeota archaeon]|nr:hypothetical protein [Candidatus Woesearchaeota archaeon]
MKQLLILLAIMLVTLAGCTQAPHIPSKYNTIELDYEEDVQVSKASFDIYESGLKPNNIEVTNGNIELIIFNNAGSSILKIENLVEEEIPPGQEFYVDFTAEKGSYRIFVNDIVQGLLVVN